MIGVGSSRRLQLETIGVVVIGGVATVGADVVVNATGNTGQHAGPSAAGFLGSRNEIRYSITPPLWLLADVEHG